jgi:hypothetical protein
MKRSEYDTYFVYGKRINDTPYTYLRDDAPEDLADLIFDIHRDIFGDCLPNHWVYTTIRHAFEELKNDRLEDITIEGDPYNHDLWQWLGEPYAAEFCDEVIQDFGSDATIYGIIGMAQANAKRLIYDAVYSFIQGDESEDEEAE